MSIPGGPRGGQAHGNLDANPIHPAYRGGRVRNLTGSMHPAMQDPFHRAPGEVVPRPNSAGELNITGIDHEKASPGFAMVPGGLFPVGGFGVGRLGAARPVMRVSPQPNPYGGPVPVTLPYIPYEPPPPVHNPLAFPPGPYPVNGNCPSGYTATSDPGCPPTAMCMPICQPNTIPVGPPSGGTQPAPVVADGCAAGMYRDAAGNCTSDWSHPYPISLPPQPSPTVPADTSGTPSAGQAGCVSGQFDASGNCIPSTVPGTTNWFTDPTQEIIPGVPNWGLVAGGAVAAYLLFGHKGRR